MLTSLWNAVTHELTVTRSNGQRYVRKQPAVAQFGQVFGVEVVGKEVHVLVGPSTNRRPNARIRFSDAAVYIGTTYGV